MNTQEFKRKLTAVFSADVAGYSRLMGEDEAATVKTLEAYKQIMFSLIKQHRGRLIDSPGDNLLAEFGSVVDAVQCGVAIQKELQARNAELPENRRMLFRIGINLGDVIEEQGRIYGDGVNVAARIEGLAVPGGVCVSGTAYDHVENKVAAEFEYLGEQAVKNIRKPVRAYQVRTKRGAPDIATRQEVSSPYKPSIAVLPFTNMSGDPEQEYFSDGITEEIITWLSKIPRLFVTARHSTFVFKDKVVSIREVGQQLGVRYVLEGSVRKSGDRIRVTAQLIDVKTDQHVWANRYDRELKDVFAIQDEITMNIMVALQAELTEGEQARLRARGTYNLEAYLKFLQAMDYFKQVGQTAVPGEDHQEDGSGVQVGAGEQAQFRENRGLHLLCFVDDQHGPIERSLDLGLPFFPKRFGPVPTVVRVQGYAEEISHFPVEVEDGGLGARENSEHDILDCAEAIGEDAQGCTLATPRLAADQSEAAFSHLVFDPPAEALSGWGGEESRGGDIGGEGVELEGVKGEQFLFHGSPSFLWVHFVFGQIGREKTRSSILGDELAKQGCHASALRL
jgi:TolB-like protein